MKSQIRNLIAETCWLWGCIGLQKTSTFCFTKSSNSCLKFVIWEANTKIETQVSVLQAPRHVSTYLHIIKHCVCTFGNIELPRQKAIGYLEAGKKKTGCGLCSTPFHMHLCPLTHHAGDSMSPGLSLPSETWGTVIGMSMLFALHCIVCSLQGWVFKTRVNSHAEVSSAYTLPSFCLEIHAFRISKDT